MSLGPIDLYLWSRTCSSLIVGGPLLSQPPSMGSNPFEPCATRNISEVLLVQSAFIKLIQIYLLKAYSVLLKCSQSSL